MSTDSDADEFSLPLKGDVPFKREIGFCLNGRKDWNALAWGYKKAAEVLTDYVAVTFAGGDLLVHPIAFLYRHHLELSIKNIIHKANQVLEPPLPMPTKSQHSIGEIWRVCRKAWEELGCRLNADDFPETVAFEACVEDFDNIDKRGDSFRYPETQGGAMLPPEQLKYLDPEHLRKMVDRMAGYIDIVRESVLEATDGL